MTSHPKELVQANDDLASGLTKIFGAESTAIVQEQSQSASFSNALASGQSLAVSLSGALATEQSLAASVSNVLATEQSKVSALSTNVASLQGKLDAAQVITLQYHGNELGQGTLASSLTQIFEAETSALRAQNSHATSLSGALAADQSQVSALNTITTSLQEQLSVVRGAMKNYYDHNDFSINQLPQIINLAVEQKHTQRIVDGINKLFSENHYENYQEDLVWGLGMILREQKSLAGSLSSAVLTEQSRYNALSQQECYYHYDEGQNGELEYHQ